MQVNIHEAKTHFSQLVERALQGEEVIIARNGQALVVLTPVSSRITKRKSGLSSGQGSVSEDFDSPLDPKILAEFE